MQKIIDAEVKVLEKEIVKFSNRVANIEIKDQKGMTVATEDLSKLNKYADQVKKTKEGVTKPLNEALKAARAIFAPIEDKLDTAISSIRNAMISYQTEQKRIADEEAAKIAARVGEGKGKLKVDTAIRKIDAIDKPEKSVSTGSGSVKFQTVKRFEVMDVTMLPTEYILANDVAIRKAMLAGIEIAGVRYYTEEVPYNSR